MGEDNRFVTYYAFDLFDEHVEGGINGVAINTKGINVWRRTTANGITSLFRRSFNLSFWNISETEYLPCMKISVKVIS